MTDEQKYQDISNRINHTQTVTNEERAWHRSQPLQIVIIRIHMGYKITTHAKDEVSNIFYYCDTERTKRKIAALLPKLMVAL